MHIPHHSHNGRRSAPQCGLLAGDFHHRTSRISSLPTSRTYPAPFFSVFNPNMTFAHHWTCTLHCSYEPIYPSMLLKRCVLLAHRIASHYHFFALQAFPTVPIASSNFPTHLIFFQARCTSLHSHFSIPARAYLTTLFAYLSAGFSEIIGKICRKFEGKSRNHLFSHTQGRWVTLRCDLSVM